MKLKFTIRFALCLVVLMSACSEMPTDPDPGPTPPPPTPSTDVLVGDLKVKTFKITPDCNSSIYSLVNFTANSNGAWQGEVEHYKADVTKLKASFDVVAAKVTVGETVQTTDLSVNDFTKPVTYRLYATDGQFKEFVVMLKNGVGTGMPIVAIFTDGGKAIDSKEEWLAGRIVLDPQESSYEAIDMAAEVKGRGNNTWRLPKKPYAVKLSEKAGVMGMNKHKRWVLLANATDRTLMRNRVAYEIGRRTGLSWTPDNRYVEIFVNGVYGGSYLLAEQIKIDKNRVNIDEMAAGDTEGDAVTGGYLLEFDRYYDEINKFRTGHCDLPVNIKEPDEKVLGPAQLTYITNYVNHIEELLYKDQNINMDYKNYIDIASFVDWWIVTELTTNRDSRLPGSCYMHKTRGGKLFAGPLWDFDLTTFKLEQGFMLADYEIMSPYDQSNSRSLWYKRLFTDPEFKALAKSRWQELKSGDAGFEGVVSFIDAECDKLRASAEVNWSMWTIDGNNNHDETLKWEEAVAKLRANYIARIATLDKLIASM